MTKQIVETNKSMNSKIIFFFLFGYCLCTQALLGQCLHLYGKITDQASHKGIGDAKMFVQLYGKKSAVSSKIQPDGTYVVDIPCEAEALMVESPKHRVFRLPLHHDESINGAILNVEVPLTLVAKDTQATDKPYLQSEQKHYTLNQKATPQAGAAFRKFLVTDAYTGKPIPAQVSLFYTTDGRKQVEQTTAAQNTFDVIFKQTDIVAIEAKAMGYQDYNGNLIINQLDNKTSTYTISMVTAVTMLAIKLTTNSKNLNCTIKSLAYNSQPMIAQGSGQFAALLPSTNATYQLSVFDSDKTDVYSKEIPIQTGLNIYLIDPTKKVTAQPVITSTSKQGAKYVLYFKQGEYALEPESKQRLDSLAYWLKSNENLRARVIGHTDNEGDRRLNAYLAEHRAKVAYNYLTLSSGVNEKKVYFQGVGSKYMVAPSDNEDNKRKNRRVEIQLIEYVQRKVE